MTNYLFYQHTYMKYKQTQSWDFLRDYSYKKLERFSKAFAKHNPAACEQHIEKILSYFTLSDTSSNINYEHIVLTYNIGLTNYSFKLLKKNFPEMTIEDHILLTYLSNYYSMGKDKKIINHMQHFQYELIRYFETSFLPDSLHGINYQLSKDIAYALGQQIFFIFNHSEEDVRKFDSSALSLMQDTEIEFKSYNNTEQSKILSDAVLYFIKNEFCEFLLKNGLSSYDKFFYISSFIKPYESLLLLKTHFPECSISFNAPDKNALENMLIQHITFVSSCDSFGFISNKFPEILKLISSDNQVFWNKLHTIIMKNTKSIEEYADLSKIIIEQNIFHNMIVADKTNAQQKISRI